MEYMCLLKSLPVFCDLILICLLRPKVKTPPQDTLLKLEKDQTLSELSVESSLFAFKLGLAKLKCSLLMNGLVYEPNEVRSEPTSILYSYTLSFNLFRLANLH